MPDFMRVHLVIDVDEIARRFDLLSVQIPQTIRQGVLASVLMLTREAIDTKLDEPPGPAEYLHRRTGNLQRDTSAHPHAELRGELVIGEFGTSLDYGKAHEEGATIHMHSRLASTRTLKGGRSVLVQPHLRHEIVLRARHMFRNTLQENLAGIQSRVLLALQELASSGDIPIAYVIDAAAA